MVMAVVSSPDGALEAHPPNDGAVEAHPPNPATPGKRSAGDAGSGKAPRSESSRGLLYGLAAYGIWGVLPLYFIILVPAGAVEIVANRIVWSLLFCAILLTATRSWRPAVTAARNPRILATLTVAAVLIAGNWLIYVYGVTSGQAIEAALGYFINPLVSVLMGVFILKEKLRPLQWGAVGIGLTAVLVLTLAYGRVPWIALGLAVSFGSYGFVKKRVGSRVDAISSLSIETAVLTPLAAGVMIWLATTGDATLLSEGPSHFWWMAAGGIITAVPLIFFGAAASRLPLSSLGLLQYLTPTLQFVIALLILQEQMAAERWLGFGLVWLALVVLTVDMLRNTRSNRKLRKAAGSV